MEKNENKSTYQDVANVLSREIIKMVQMRDTLANQALKSLEPEVQEIIHSKCYDINKIEESLDRLLDYCFDGRILPLYRKLCRYYYQIDQAAAVEYVNAYRNMWECG